MSRAEAAHPERTTARRGRVLVVDDEEVIAETLREFLEAEGFEVAVAGDAAGALRQVAAFEPDLALCDIQLPGLDGLDLLDRLLRVRPELFGSLRDQRGEFCDDLRDGALGDPEKIGNNFFDYILPLVEQRDHYRFSQREALRPPDSLIPGLGQDIFDTRLKFIELSGIQSEGTMVTQRLLHRWKVLVRTFFLPMRGAAAF